MENWLQRHPLDLRLLRAQVDGETYYGEVPDGYSRTLGPVNATIWRNAGGFFADGVVLRTLRALHQRLIDTGSACLDYTSKWDGIDPPS